jgi:hypothetical protein
VRQRIVMWVVLAGMLVGAGAIAVVATGNDPALKRLPALALGGVGRDEAAMSADSAGGSSKMMAPGYGGATYEVEGELPKLDGEGPVYELKGEVDAADVAELAKALGIDAKVVDSPSAWLVASDADHQLRVDKGPGHSWYFGQMAACGTPTTEISPDGAVSSDDKRSMEYVDMPGCPAYDEQPSPEPLPAEECPPDRCESFSETGTAVGSAGGGTDGSVGSEPNTGAPTPSAVPAPPPSVEECKARAEAGNSGAGAPEGVCAEFVEPERPADLPSKAEAERIARDLLANVGLNLDGASVRVEDGFSMWYVNVDPMVNGLPTFGWPWSVSVGPKGALTGVSGWLDTPDHLDDYPLAGTDVGLERLRNGGGYGQWMPYPMAARDATEPAIAIDCPPEADCPAPEPQVVTITGVKLGLQFAPVYTEDGPGTPLLIPTYLFEAKDNDYPLPVIAVTDEYLPEQPEPPIAGDDPAAVTGSSASCSAMGTAISPDGSEPANKPLQLSVCTTPTNPQAGEEVTFDLTLSDEDAPIEDCVDVSFGDGEGGNSCPITDCATTPADVKPEPGKAAKQLRHTYSKAGTYEVTFTGHSGTCNATYGSQGSSSVTITVHE